MIKKTENIKKIILSVTEFGNVTGKILEDGKINLNDITLLSSLPGAVMNFYSVVTNFTELKDEVLDLTEEELTELKEYFNKNFDIPQDDFENTVKKVIDGIDIVWDAFQTIAKIASLFTTKK